MTRSHAEPVVRTLASWQLLDSFDQLMQTGPEWAFTRPHSGDYLDAVQAVLCHPETCRGRFWRICTTEAFGQILDDFVARSAV